MVQQIFVARERELGRLDAFLQRALAAQGAVCFVTGEAGSGKTALVTEFARRAQEAHEDLVVAVGQSDAQTGIGDAYLPFREVLGQLTGDVEAKLAQGAITEENAGRLRKLLVLSGQALVEVGPDLVGIFVPGVGLATRVGAFVAEKVGWLDKLERMAGRPRAGQVPGATAIEQGQIFEQYTNVLNRLAQKQPLLVVLDDLQWADAASIGLLFRLARRIEASRILIVGTYRPEEVAIGRAGERHPLEKVLAELKRYHGDVAVDLDTSKEAEGRRFVDAFLDTESNRLGEGFRWALLQHTDGHPLFTIELLRDMQERGDLVRDERGRWVEGPALDWDELPVRVEGVIEERIGRLEAELREALTVGSVEGEDFTAEVVAQVQATEARGLIRRLSGELAKQHRLVSGLGVQRVEGRRLSLYRFEHNLFQKYLYGELGEAERAYLHEDVGAILEDLYGSQVDEIAVQLARHFVEAGVQGKAVRYLRRAGEQAAARFAHAEAETYFGRALDLTPADDLQTRYALLRARERVYDVQGKRELQEQDLEALGKVSEALDDDQKRAEVELRRAQYAQVRGDYPATVAGAQATIALAQVAQDKRSEAGAHQQWGVALWRQGQYQAAQVQLQNALHLYREVQDRYGEGIVLNNLGIVTHLQGNSERAKTHLEQALQIRRAIGDRRGEGSTLNNLGGIAAAQGDYAAARIYYEQALLIQRETGNRYSEALTLGNLGVLSAELGDYDRAQTHLEQALSIHREIGDRQGEGVELAHLGSLHHQVGADEAARDCSQQALLIAREVGNRRVEGHALGFLGDSQVGLGLLDEATAAYQQALTLWRELGSTPLALEPLAGLARVSLARDDLAQAQTYVEEILSRLEDSALRESKQALCIYPDCYRVLRALSDPRADSILEIAHDLLQTQAARISDAEMQRSFLQEVPAHQEILREFEASQGTANGEREGGA
jgi:adenylate cyclase